MSYAATLPALVAELSTPALSRDGSGGQSRGMGHRVIAIVVRLVVLLVALSGYYAALPFLFPGSTDANIGAGLIAFGVVVLVSFGWAAIDGRRRGSAATMLVWAVVAVAFGSLWLLGLAVLEADDSMSIAERLRLDAFLAVFTAGLVLVPAGLGAALGGSSHHSDG
jgi:hypothetical protein